MVASALACSASWSRATILACARLAPCATSSRIRASASCRCTVASLSPRRSRIDNEVVSKAAISRSVGMPVRPGKSRVVSGNNGNDNHGARKTSSSRSSAHCRASACDQTLASLSGCNAGSAAKCPARSAAHMASCSTCTQAAASVADPVTPADVSVCSNCATTARSPPTVSSRSAKVSLRPFSHRRLRIGVSGRAVRPGRRVSRWAARLPLSTVDT